MNFSTPPFPITKNPNKTSFTLEDLNYSGKLKSITRDYCFKNEIYSYLKKLQYHREIENSNKLTCPFEDDFKNAMWIMAQANDLRNSGVGSLDKLNKKEKKKVLKELFVEIESKFDSVENIIETVAIDPETSNLIYGYVIRGVELK